MYLLTQSEGINIKKIVDFEIRNDRIYLLHKSGVLPIQINQLQYFDFKPNLLLKDVLVNDVKYPLSKSIFNYKQNKITFNLSSKSLKYKDGIKYQYQLIGVDAKWQYNSYENNIISYKYLPSGSYTFIVKAIYKNNESQEIEYKFKITKPIWKQWLFYFLLGLLFIAITVFVFKRESKKQRREALLKNELSISKLTAIKSQMNPHFIFNSLNSIQDLVLQEDGNNAYNYIGKFALLVRKILHHSDKDFIDIEDELKVLEVYLELEKLRFKKNFSFNIETKNTDNIEIPPMIIQPFVENTIKHRLLHKKGSKKISVKMAIVDEELICTILDNGVGRAKSQEIKSRQNKSHKSFSVKSTNNRFDILRRQYGGNPGVIFEDLKSEEDIPIGTKVVLTIPFRRKF